MVDKPADVYDRDREWSALEKFVGSDRPGATLGLVYGRRRQGKTFLLETLAEANGGFYFAALRQSSTQNLARLGERYRLFTGSRARIAFGSWEEALESLLALGENATSAVPVIIDEFPYLLDGAPELPSLLQALLSPKSAAVRGWRTRLLLCGSALSTMRQLLSGTAVRGRASLELLVQPFSYRDAAGFWGVHGQPPLAMRLHALLGGTAAYLDMCGGVGPTSAGELDDWVARSLLDPSSAMFREGNVLLSEEERIADTAMYFSVLTAISQGKTRRGEIAAAIGKAEGALAHPLTVLTQAQLVAPLSDAVKQKRTTFHVAEPVLRLHQLVIAPNESRLARHHATDVWTEVADTVAAKIYGPHFEHLARFWCAEHAAAATLGGTPSKVGLTEVACPEHRCHHEVDVVVIQTKANAADRIAAIGEAKWRTPAYGTDQLRRLEHIRELLGLAAPVRLLLFSGSGFSPQLTAQAAARADVQLVDVERLYQGS